jgi:ribose transport system substrate-binding protein
MKAQQSMNSPRCFPWLAWGLSAVLLGSAHGCGGGVPEAGTTTASTASKTKSEKPRIALIMKSLANEFFKTMADGARKHQGEHSSEYELIVNGIKDERDLKRQVDLVEEMVAQRVDAIVIAPADSKVLVSACKHAQEAGIAVVNIDNKLDSQVLADQGVKVPFVGPDNRAGARMVGDYMAGKLKSGDKVAMFEGIKTAFNGQQRKLGFEDAVKDAGLPIVDSQSALWEIEPASKIASAMLSEHPEIKGLCWGSRLLRTGAGHSGWPWPPALASVGSAVWPTAWSRCSGRSPRSSSRSACWRWPGARPTW